MSSKYLKIFAAVAGVSVVALSVYCVYQEIQKKRKNKSKYTVVFVLGGPGAGKVSRISIFLFKNDRGRMNFNIFPFKRQLSGYSMCAYC